MRLPNPSAVRPASPTGSVASFAVRVIARRGRSFTASIVGQGADCGYTAFARWPARPLYQIANRQHGGYQVAQRPSKIGLGDHDHAVVEAKMAHGAACYRAVGRRLGGQGTRDSGLPLAAVAALGGVNHPPPHDAVLLNTGHYYLHRNPPCPAVRPCLVGAPPAQRGRLWPAGRALWHDPARLGDPAPGGAT